MKTVSDLSTLAGLTRAPVQAQRKCASCDKESKVPEEKEEEEKVHRKSAGAGARMPMGGSAPPAVAAALIRPGRTLDYASRSFFEPRHHLPAVWFNQAIEKNVVTLKDAINSSGILLA